MIQGAWEDEDLYVLCWFEAVMQGQWGLDDLRDTFE